MIIIEMMAVAWQKRVDHATNAEDETMTNKHIIVIGFA